jgi:ribose transport system ATP-binding protein
MALALDAEGLQKRFGAVVALRDGRIRLAEGEVHALLGANGCGKSTLCKIIAGTVRRDAGAIRVGGRETEIRRPREAEALGIGLFYQELSLVPQLSVEDNLFLGHELRGTGGFADRRALRRRAEELIAIFAGVAGEGFTPDAPVSGLSPDQRQLAELLKVLARQPKIMILDEPTAALDRASVEVFFALLRRQKGEGVSSILISHRLDEVFEIADRITVMRNGATVAELETAATNQDEVVRHMVGDALKAAGRRAPPAEARGEALLAVHGVAGERVREATMALAPGEIVGLGGLQGQGQSSLLRGLFGAPQFRAGWIDVAGAKVTIGSPNEAVRRGLAYVSGDRGRDSALHGRSIFENLIAATLVRERLRLVKPRPLKERARAVAATLNTKFGGLDDPIGTLSGGNQQKVFIGRWLAVEPRIFLLDDPTKGIDLAAKADLFALMREMAEGGAAILFYSTESLELIENCDRVLVMNSGRITTELKGETLDDFHLYRAAYGEAA